MNEDDDKDKGLHGPVVNRIMSIDTCTGPRDEFVNSRNVPTPPLSPFRMQELDRDVNAQVFDSMEDYIKAMEGKRAISKILVANNGISAVKAIRSIRRWSYEMFADDRKVEFVTMATPEDLRANAEYIRMADQVVEVPGGANNNNYANVMLIVDIAERWAVDAVFVGWGHASEMPLLPDSLRSRGIIFIGPPGKPMRALGDKIGSTIIAQSANVPTIAWNGDSISVDYAERGEIPAHLYDRGTIHNVEEAIAESSRIGYPVMIKASEGGGGKGIRKVLSQDAVAQAFTAVQGEIPGSPIFIMKLAPKSRHLEVQLLADEYGDAISLSGRDCSIQRRHQKIVEEGPVLAPSNAVWKEMELAATLLAKEVNYVNAGTVEYLYTEDGQYYFLELNPRLQVEHPVTEMITNVNLPAAQLQVAMGVPLHRIPDVRRYYLKKDPYGTSRIDFERDAQALPQGHVIAARITAENPDAGFQPTSGAIEEINFRSSPDVWGYFSVDSSGRVHEFADSQIGHLFAWGNTRNQSRKHMIGALKELSIRGDIRTTVEYIIKMMESDDFIKNNISTSWLDERIAHPADYTSITDGGDNALIALVGALCTSYAAGQARQDEYTKQLGRGQIPSVDLLQQQHDVELILHDQKFKMKTCRSGPHHFVVYCNEFYVKADVRVLSDGGYLLIIFGKSHVAYMSKVATGLRLILNGHTSVFTNEYDPTRILSNVAGKLVRYLVKDGSSVSKGTAFAEVEVMKMYMPIVTTESGVLTFASREGSIITPSDCIATMQLDDPSCVKKSVAYSGLLIPEYAKHFQQHSPIKRAGYQLKNALSVVETVLDGYVVPDEEVEDAVSNLFLSLENVTLPCDEIREEISKLAGRIPSSIFEVILQEISTFEASFKQSSVTAAAELEEFDLGNIEKLLRTYPTEQEMDETESAAFFSVTAPLLRIVENYKDGLHSRHSSIVNQLVKKYFSAESYFAMDKLRDEDTLMELRREYHNDLTTVYGIARSHAALSQKNSLMLQILKSIQYTCSSSVESSEPSPEKVSPNLDDFSRILEKFANLKPKEYSLVALEARHMLIDHQGSSFADRKSLIESSIQKLLLATDDIVKNEIRSEIVNTAQPIFHILMSLLTHADNDVRLCSLELYLKRIYRSYELCTLQAAGTSDSDFIYSTFEFRSVQKNKALDMGIKGSDSFDDLASLILNSSPQSNHSEVIDTESDIRYCTRRGVIASFDSLTSMFDHFFKVLNFISDGSLVSDRSKTGEPLNVMHFAIYEEPLVESEALAKVTDFLSQHRQVLHSRSIRRITFAVRQAEVVSHRNSFESVEYDMSSMLYPGIYTFREKLNYMEDTIVRHIEAPLAFILELKRLSNYNVNLVETANKNVHIYRAAPKQKAMKSAGIKTSAVLNDRLFVRVVVRHTDRLTSDTHVNSVYDAFPGPERVFVDALHTLELAMGQEDGKFTNNHLFLSVLPDAVVEPQYVETVIRRLASRYAEFLQRLCVSQVEFKISARFTEDAARIPLRFVACNPTGFVLRVETYVEANDLSNDTPSSILTSIGDDGQGSLDGQPVLTPYPVAHSFDHNRATAAAMSDTIFVYDFLEVFEHAVLRSWRKGRNGKGLSSALPSKLMESVELLFENNRIVETDRPAGQNSIGMVAWRLTLYTPEYPVDGREIVVIANDITFKAGSFGTSEDALFKAASAYARDRGCPRIYLAANSGARIGMAESVKSKYRVAWCDINDQTKGFEYLYLTEEDYGILSDDAVLGEMIEVNGEKRFVLTDIIGEEADIGVENLRGSGGIAGETSRAFKDIVTMTYVCGRSVGIGAYLVRLGQRTIQKESNAPIILTGYQALNKLMGKEVYKSNDQLGGTKIMHTNGISHVVVKNHMQGVDEILKWLSFVPAVRNGPLPVTSMFGMDNIERRVDFIPSKSPYDPRYLISGCVEDGTWKSGFMDRGSVVESLCGWAKSVVVGRARLGGIPIGFIMSEVRTAEKVTPADPAAPATQENLIQQAGQVWFPDSAHKTATAIRDFNGEGLPLIIFANWRGFSGGQRDMFDEVLKFGASIVDNLVAYTQPVFVYIPPYAELRGGAWVVVDPTINTDVMEMYASKDARGGVLEPAGLVAIKYRKKELIKTAHRLDLVLQRLDLELADAEDDEEYREEIKQRIQAREVNLLGTYTQIAMQFADLQDTPGRMKATGAIRDIVPWTESRKYFYWRLRRKLLEFDLRREVMKAGGTTVSFEEAGEVLQEWFEEENQEFIKWNDADVANDRNVINWMLDEKCQIKRRIDSMNHDRISSEVLRLGLEDSNGAVQGILELVQKLEATEREKVVTALRRGSIFSASRSTH